MSWAGLRHWSSALALGVVLGACSGATSDPSAPGGGGGGGGSESVILDPPVVVQGISSSTTPFSSKTWSIGCSALPCYFRYAINQSSSLTDLSSETYTSVAANTLSVSVDVAAKGAGTFYLHAQAKDMEGRQSVVKTVSVVLQNGSPPAPGPFAITGSILFEDVPPASGPYRLNYSAVQQRPARRVLVQAIEMMNGAESGVFTVTNTDDNGQFTLSIPDGVKVKVRAVAQMTTGRYTKDGVGPLENCDGASWD
ncbi:MAG: hypothetical protein KGQ59_09070, partial [Bdellovibrionales bacterium]|nr:hypothetical protein [Bdellovibrionales bacterium]